MFGIGAIIFNSLRFASAVQCSDLLSNFNDTNFSGVESATGNDIVEVNFLAAFNFSKSLSIVVQVSRYLL